MVTRRCRRHTKQTRKTNCAVPEYDELWSSDFVCPKTRNFSCPTTIILEWREAYRGVLQLDYRSSCRRQSLWKKNARNIPCCFPAIPIVWLNVWLLLESCQAFQDLWLQNQAVDHSVRPILMSWDPQVLWYCMLEEKKENKSDFVYAYCFEEYQTIFFLSRMYKIFLAWDSASWLRYSLRIAF